MTSSPLRHCERSVSGAKQSHTALQRSVSEVKQSAAKALEQSRFLYGQEATYPSLAKEAKCPLVIARRRE